MATPHGGSRTCPAGHAFDPAEGRFCTTCGMLAACPHGHPLGAGTDACGACEPAAPGLASDTRMNVGSAARAMPRGWRAYAFVGVLVSAIAASSIAYTLSPGSNAEARTSALKLKASAGAEQAPTSAASPSGEASQAPATSTNGGPAATVDTQRAAPTATPSRPAATTVPAQVQPTSTPTRTATPAPLPPTATPTRTPTPVVLTVVTVAPTAAPQSTATLSGYFKLGVAGGTCGGCEVSLVGPVVVLTKASSSGYYSVGFGLPLPPGTYALGYDCRGKFIPTQPASVTLKPGANTLDIIIGFCG